MNTDKWGYKHIRHTVLWYRLIYWWLCQSSSN